MLKSMKTDFSFSLTWDANRTHTPKWIHITNISLNKYNKMRSYHAVSLFYSLLFVQNVCWVVGWLVGWMVGLLGLKHLSAKRQHVCWTIYKVLNEQIDIISNIKAINTLYQNPQFLLIQINKYTYRVSAMNGAAVNVNATNDDANMVFMIQMKINCIIWVSFIKIIGNVCLLWREKKNNDRKKVNPMKIF